jgi:hypothetical protein
MAINSKITPDIKPESLQGCKMLRIQHSLESPLTDGGKVP